MKHFLLLTIYCFCLSAIQAQVNIAPIQNWNQQVDNERYIFIPNNAGTNFTYEVMPLEKGSNGTLDEWLKKTAEQQIKSGGYSLSSAKDFALVDVMNYKTCAALVADPSGKKWMISYMAYKTNSNNIRYVKMTMPAGSQNTYMNVAIKHFINLSRQENNSQPAEAHSSAAKEKQQQSNKKDDPVITGGKTLKSEEIKGVVLNLEYGYGVGGMVIAEYNPYLLLKDGSIYQNSKVSPYDLNVALSKQAEPEKWGTWKLEGKTMVVQLQEKGVMKTKRWDKNWYWARPAENNEKIQGAFKTIGGGGNTAFGGTTMIITGSNIAFNNKGQFTLEKYSGGSSYDFDWGVSTSSKKNTTGTYTLNGYSIELRFNNNEVLKKMFYFFPDSKMAFGLGTDTYTEIKK